MLGLMWLVAVAVAGDVRLGSDPLEVDGAVADVALAPDGSWLFASGALERVVHVWDGRTGRSAGVLLPGASSPVRTLAVTAGATHVAVGWQDAVAVFTTDGLAPVASVDLAGQGVREVAPLPDGGLLVSADRGGVRLLGPGTFAVVRTLVGDGVTELSVSDDGRYAAGCAGATTTVWRLSDGVVEEKFVWAAPEVCTGVVWGVGRNDLWAAGSAGSRWVWNATSGAGSLGKLAFGRIQGWTRTAGSPYVLASTDKGVLTLDARDGRVLLTRPVASGPLRVSATQAGTVAAVVVGGSGLSLVNPTTGLVAVTPPATHTGVVRGFGWGGAVVFTGGDDGQLLGWMPADGRSTASIALDGGPIRDVAASSSDLVLVAAEAGGMLMPSRGPALWYSDGRWRSVAMTRTGQWGAAGSDGGTLALVDAATGSARLLKLDSAIERIAFSPDGTKVVCGTAGNHVTVIDVKKAALVYDHPLQRSGPGYAVAVGFTPDGKSVWAGGLGGELARLTPGSPPAEGVIKVGEDVTDMAVLADGRLVVGTRSGVVSVLEAKGAVLAKIPGHGAAIVRLSVSPDGKKVVVSDASGQVWVHDVP